MSLRTRMLATVFCVMVAVLALLTLSLAADALARTRREQIRHGERVAAWVQDWLIDQREKLAAIAETERWGELARRLGQSSLVTDWVVAARPRAGGPAAAVPAVETPPPRLEVLASRASEFEATRGAWEGSLGQALGEMRAVVRGTWVATPLLFPDGRVVGIAMAVPTIMQDAPDLGGTFLRMAWVMLLGTALLLLVMYILLQRFVLRPMDALLAAAERAARGDFSRPIPEPRFYDEMATLVRAFNGMMERVAEHRRTLEEDIVQAHGRLSDTERRLLVAQRLSSTGTLAAGIAHEINNPLGGLLNAARALRARAGDDPRAQAYTALILEGLERIQATVQQLLRFAPRAAPPRTFALADAVEPALALCAHRFGERGVRVTSRVPRSLPLLHGDPGEVQQAVLNVVLNAVDAAPPRDGQVMLETREADGHVLLTVTDNGRGMDPDVLQHAADPFYTTKAPGTGTGLGLAVVESIMERHGGTLGLASETGKGAEITLAFPVAPEAVRGAGDPPLMHERTP